MKRGTAAKVILGKDTLMDVPAGIVHGTDVILGGKAGLLNDFGGLVLSNNLMIGKKVSRGTITTVTVRGQSPLVLPDAISGSLQAVKAFGGTEQNGTPTPDAPVDIVSNNGVLKYGAIGKNLLNLNAPGVINGDFISDSGRVTHDNTSTISDFIPCTEGTYYTAQTVARASGSNFRIHGYDENKNWVQMLAKSPASVGVITTATCQIPAEIKYIKVCGYMMGEVGKDAMLEFGSTATPYEPYMAGIYADGTVETIQATSKNLFAYTSLFDTYVTVITYHTFDIPNGTYTMSTPDFPVGQSNATNVFVFAGTATSGASSSTNGVTSTTPRTITVTDGKYTVAYRSYHGNNTKDPKDFRWQLELGSTATAYAPYYNGGTATAEMLLKVGDYQDVQSIIDGVVTRNVGVKVLDGTENWETTAQSTIYRWLSPVPFSLPNIGICSHYVGVTSNKTIAEMPDMSAKTGSSNASYLYIKDSSYSNNLSGFKQWLADQYAAGTPVIVIYPLATPTTESVTGQALQVTGGDNVLEITQASLNNLELEATYNSLVQLTIQEVEDANLNNNVEVTIS